MSFQARSRFRISLAGIAAVAWLAALPIRAHVVPAIRAYDGMDPSSLPPRLSGTGLYGDVAAKTRKPSEGIRAYEINAPLWSDGSAKQRFVDLPTETKIVPTDTDHYAIPDGAVFIKNFAIDTVYGDSATRILIETRFLVVRRGQDTAQRAYHGFTYKWRRDQKDAELVDPGASLDTAIRVRWNGKIAGKRWTYPAGSACTQCHRGRGTLGFITPQLNRPDAADPAVNQLKALFTAGILSKDVTKAGLHRWVGLKETGTAASKEAKARSYLAANCSHCHGNGIELEGAAHDFDWLSAAREIKYPKSEQGYVGKPAMRDAAWPQIVYPGYPESSFVVFRMQARGDLEFRGVDQMPPLATYQMDSAAVGAVRDWICSLAAKARTCPVPGVQDDASYWETATGFPHAMPAPRIPRERPILRAGLLTLPGAASFDSGVRLLTIGGAEVALTPLGGGRWRVRGTASGLYLVFAGGTAAMVSAQ